MRILQIRFKNLNSLVGQWEIDLTHPAFVSDGIFAITGPTGAGKTTILDAVCLALYGRTPRLSKVTKSGNEIMSRQTGECFAEVTFETQAGRYRCHWSQHRARRRADGELQAPKHEIAQADSGQIVESKIRGVADQIETATGMDFDRFTRSMLLAQGGFAAFLQAAPDERAPILEQITGTEIYSRISIRVHQRRADERKRLETLQAEAAGIQVLAPEVEQQLAADLQQQLQQDTELTRQVTQKNQAITWIEGMRRLETELQQLGQENEALQARMEAFAPDHARLEAATRALELDADCAALTALREEHGTDRRRLHEYRESLPQRVEAAGQAEAEWKAATEQREARRTEQHEAQPLIRKVRELDVKMAEKDARIQEAQGSLADVATSVESLRARQQSDCAELDSTRAALDELRQRLEATSADEGLVEHLAGIRSRFETLQVLNAQRNAKLGELAEAERHSQDASRTWQQQSGDLETANRSREKIHAQFKEEQARLRSTLEDRELADWRKSLSLLAAQKERIAKAVDAALTLTKSQQTAGELAERQTALDAEESGLARSLADHAERQAALQREQELLEDQLILLKRIEDLEQARRELRDGEPCPLCGAKEHPYAEGNVPVPDETRQRLARVRGDLQSVSDTISEEKIRQAKLRKDIEQAASGQKECGERIEDACRWIGEFCAQLPAEPNLTAADPELEAKLREIQGENARQLDHATSTLEAAESIEKQVAAVRELFEQAKDAVAKAERAAQAAAHKKDAAEQLVERLKKEADAHRDQLQNSLVQLQTEVRAFGVETLAIDRLDEVLGQLTRRRDQWLSRQRERTELDQKMGALQIQTRHRAEQIQKVEDEFHKLEKQLEDLLRDREDFARQRQELFGDKQPDAEEKRLSAAVAEADTEWEATRHKSEAARQQRDQLQSKIDELQQAIETRGPRLQSSEASFLARLEQSGFADEASYRRAGLPEDERKELAQQARKLSDENTALASRRREKAKLLETEHKRQVTEEPLDDLKHALANLVDKQKELQQEIGRTRERIRENETRKQQQQERLQAIDAQQRECSRWDLLHELIGSADGKKYRNFAQGLTFEMMVGHANRQLQKMTDRYLLVRDESQPLELNVVDNYQAGEIRSTKNLSGGESFLVSLSLALGLSQMASKNVRVDSLFLDEGFGTLDEEALDTALETLAGLQQDGKLIGVISHVSALKERISTQIQVTPQTGGRSHLAGPGCKRAAPA